MKSWNIRIINTQKSPTREGIIPVVRNNQYWFYSARNSKIPNLYELKEDTNSLTSGIKFGSNRYKVPRL
jgi:hypothetical protein